MYGVVLAPLMIILKPEGVDADRGHYGLVALLYPMLRIGNLVPINGIVSVAADFSAERANSLRVRFYNETELLNRATERVFFGWGRYGRNRIYDEDTGKDLSLTDGRWIITLGQFGLFGFIAEFGLLVLPIFLVARARRFCEAERDQLLLAALALISAVTVFDLLPNAAMTPWTWLVSGSLLGRAEALRAIHIRPRRLNPKALAPEEHAAG